MKLLLIIFYIICCSVCFSQGKITNGVRVAMSKQDVDFKKTVDSLYEIEKVGDSISNKHKFDAINSLRRAAKNSEGVEVSGLSLAQIRALFSLWLFKQGLVDSSNYKVKSLDSWGAINTKD